MMVMFRENGIHAEQQIPLKIQFHGYVIGDFYPDIVVENKIVLELKSQDRIIAPNRAQTLNYLRATGFKLAIILNFGKSRMESERLVL